MSTNKATSREKTVESSQLRVMKGVLRELQQDAKAGRSDKLTLAEINREIAGVRRKKSKPKRLGS